MKLFKLAIFMIHVSAVTPLLGLTLDEEREAVAIQLELHRYRDMQQPEQTALPQVPDLTVLPERPDPPRQVDRPTRLATRRVWAMTGTRTVKQCVNGVCSYYKVPTYGWIDQQVRVPDEHATMSSADNYATPLDATKRMLEYMWSESPKTLLDLGSGDGRVIVNWAVYTGYPAIGIEIDPERVAATRAFAERKGVSHLVTVIEGDYSRMRLPDADIVYVYQFDDELASLKDKLSAYDKIVSYRHRVPGLDMLSHNSGEFYSWSKPASSFTANEVKGVWYGNKYYTKYNLPHNGRCNCGMCRWIKSQVL